ncbi:glycosyltransferase [Streptomyces sp. NPDC052043]|uniref:glycosyltransferase n=1 Tax=Streptomyces sp. NPDC052043 TaxID=3365684 RepID=UPI0037CE69AB
MDDVMFPRFGVVVVAPGGDAERAVRSLLRQSTPAARITVVTATAGGAPGGKADRGVRTVGCAPEELGAACVEAALATDAEYVAFLDGGDEALPDWLWHLSRAAHHGAGDAGEPVGLLQCGVLRLRADGLVDGTALPPATPGTRPVPADLADGVHAVRRDLLGPGKDEAAVAVTVPLLLVRRRAGGSNVAVHAPGARVIRGSRPTRGTPRPAADRRPRDGSAPELVSVVIPVRNGARTLGAQLRALAGQTATVPWEVLVVDNGSTDATRQVAEGARGMLPGLRVVDASGRAGESCARNRGIAEAKGDFVAFCDADDVAHPGWLAALAEAAKEAHVVGGSLETELLSPGHGDEQPLPMDAQTDFLPFARGANCAAWKDVLSVIGGWNEHYRGGGEDMDLSWRAHLCGYRVAYAAEARMHYRLRDELSSLARQKWNYGKSGAQLYAEYRHAGYQRRRARTVVMNWCWLLVHVPDLARSPLLRRRWVRYGARLAGFLAGSLRRGVGYL